MFTKENCKVFVSHDNSKTGIDSFNLLAGDVRQMYNGATPKTENALATYASRGIIPENCTGTCGQNCPGCYAKRMTRYTMTFVHAAENTFFVKLDPAAAVHALEVAIYADGNAPELFRVHDTGDFMIDVDGNGQPGEKSFIYFSEMCEMMKRHPETHFGAYTKCNALVYRYGVDNLPVNFSLQCSPWAGVSEPIADLPQFIYDDGSNPEISALPHCPAVDCHGHRTGIQCKTCGYCYHAKRGGRRAVYAH